MPMMYTLIVVVVIIQLCIIPLFQALEIPFNTTITSTKYNTKTPVSQIYKNLCCPCDNYTKKIVNKTKVNPVRRAEVKLFRLPDSIVPLEYNLSLKFDFLRFQRNRFDEAVGNVSITVKVKRKTRVILFHCGDNIVINSISLRRATRDGKLRNSLKYAINSGILNITLKSDLVKDENYIIDVLNFTVKYFLNQDSGILTRIFESENGTHDYILATQLEPESARDIFPCFDEPKFKAIFNVKIRTNLEFNILSNSPASQCKETTYWKTCQFEPTPLMSTYNLAFSINNFQYIEHVNSNNMTYRIWARQSQINNSVIAMNFTVEIFKIFESMFMLKFPLRKVDSLAIPNLKVFLGMEHFGLITYDESIIVQNERFPLSFSRHLCALIISHEISHQWFGNIVTTGWWKDLWLNEGFATYYSYRVAGTVLKNDQFYILEKLSLMNYLKHMDDFYSSPRATINFPVIERAESKFDYLSYKKGFIIISMIEEIMQKELFDLSMIHYVQKHQYSSVYPKQLWETLQLFSKNNVEKILENWISKFCYPIVNVSIVNNVLLNIVQKSSINFDRNGVNFQSKQYVTNQWNLPLFIMYGNDTFQSKISLLIFDKLNGSLSIPNFNVTNHWVVINSNYISLYTVDYDGVITDRLIKTLLKNHDVIPPLSRAHIIQDYYDSSKKLKRNNFKRLFQLLSYIEKETHPVPLVTAITLIDKLNGLFQLRTSYLSWHRFVSKILTPSLKKLVDDFTYHFQNVDTTSRTLRRMLLNIACKLKLSYCQNITDSIVKRWLNNSMVRSDFDLLHIALCRYIEQDQLGDNWIRVYKDKMFQSWDFISVKYYAMGCSKVSWVIEKNIDIVFNVLQNQIDRQNFPHVSTIGIDEMPADYLQAITPLGNILILSATYNYPNFQTILVRFTRIGLHLLCNSIIFEPHFPIPKSIIEYAIPTLSHYNFIKQIYNTHGESKDALLIDAKTNIEWMQKVDNLNLYLSEYSDSDINP